MPPTHLPYGEGKLFYKLYSALCSHADGKLNAEELAIVASWKFAVGGSFFVFRYLKQSAVFLSDKLPPTACGVLALASPLEEVIGTYLPVLVKGVLLPINGRIISDGLLSTFPIAFGPGIRRSLSEN